MTTATMTTITTITSPSTTPRCLREAVERDVAAARNQSLDEGGGPSYGEVDLTPRGDRHPRSAGASRGEASGTASSPGVRRHIKGLNHGLGYL